ncbi:MAG: thiol reductant ABC exporter subunit CydC [Gammaproteobacteria bacterium]|nr:thiol reductant ABC exporter subunit CydC [Gammaproteobacteria bacterium]
MKRLLTLLALYRPFYGWMALGVLASLATLLANVTLMATSGWFITSMALAGAAQMSMNYFTPAAIIRGAAIMRTGGRYVERLLTHEATLRLLAVLRGWFYIHLEPLAPAALQQHHSGDLLSRVRADIDTLDNLYLRLLVPGITALLATLILSLYLASHDTQFGAVLFALLMAAGVGVPLLVLRLSRTPARAQVTLMAAQRTAIIDAVQGMGELLLYGADGAQAGRVAHTSRALVDAQAQLTRVQGLSQAALLLCANLAVWLLLWLAIPQVEQGTLAKPDLAMLSLFTLAAFEAVMPLPVAFKAYGATLAAAERLFAIVDTPPPVREPRAGQALPDDLTLTLHDVSFTYPGAAQPAIDELTLQINPGDRITLMGPSGAGKSTLIDLLLRFRDPGQGCILLGGQPLSAFDSDTLRTCFGVVSQNTHLFTATVRDNLLLARPDATEEEIERACRAAGIHDTLTALPDGYDTWLGEAGANLSGGQARRVAIARALLKDAPILLLDEPTEGLDASTARRLLQTLAEVACGRSVLLITHLRVPDGLFGPVVELDRGHIVLPPEADA